MKPLNANVALVDTKQKSSAKREFCDENVFLKRLKWIKFPFSFGIKNEFSNSYVTDTEHWSRARAPHISKRSDWFARPRCAQIFFDYEHRAWSASVPIRMYSSKPVTLSKFNLHLQYYKIDLSFSIKLLKINDRIAR